MEKKIVSITGSDQGSESLVPLLSTALEALRLKPATPDVNEDVEHLNAALKAIAQFYRMLAPLQTSLILVPRGAYIESRAGQRVSVSQLVVQLAARGVAPACSTLQYTPTLRTRIELRVLHEGGEFISPDWIQWTTMTDNCASAATESSWTQKRMPAF